MSRHRDAIICDLAETYGVYDYHQHRGTYIATLVSGLRPSSRLFMALSGMNGTQTDFLLANVLDGVNLLVWSNTEDARKGRNRPKRISEFFLKQEKPNEVDVFDSPEAFESARQAILNNLQEG